jgi:hypothetical protein
METVVHPAPVRVQYQRAQAYAYGTTMALASERRLDCAQRAAPS